ncbi:MAG: UDP-N-acetylmuramoyl-L-alanyl-D-glutamate--2,6-diaminopimelate ligase [Polyangiaceae bacterium]
MTPSASSPPRHAAPGASLTALAQLLGGRASGEARVTGVAQDSRRVAEGDLFVALSGAQVDGTRFIPMAVARGAAAIMVDEVAEVSDPGVPLLAVAAPRRALAGAAAAIYGHPTRAMTVVGITGTNGKTTTAHLVERALVGAGLTPGIVGTLGYRGGGASGPLIHTSPEADELQRIAAELVGHGVSHLVMEVSSIALAADRVLGVDFDVVAFTNLTQDHLDWHGSMEAYAAAKELLFTRYAADTAVINVDDPHGAALASRIEGRVIRVGEGGDVRVIDAELGPSGMRVSLGVAGRRHELVAPLSGRHNLQNVMLAAGIAHALELDLDAALGALEVMAQVPGRLEMVSGPEDDVAAFVDYAHTPDALERVLQSLQPEVGSLWCVFGCGGDRDRQKRGPMGEVVGRLADHAIVTNDNPRSEDPQAIADAVVAGLARSGQRAPRVILDRKAAIAEAVAEAQPGDVILVAGKGHEPYQIIGDQIAELDDRVELSQALRRRRGDR